jgi:ketosteroid isomerase-like protein
MSTAVTGANNEGWIRELVNERAKAVRAKDVDAAMANNAPDIVSFDGVNPLQKIGIDECRKRAEEWFSSFPNPIEYEISELSISATDTLAFSHSLNHVNATNNDGIKIG